MQTKNINLRAVWLMAGFTLGAIATASIYAIENPSIRSSVPAKVAGQEAKL